MSNHEVFYKIHNQSGHYEFMSLLSSMQESIIFLAHEGHDYKEPHFIRAGAVLELAAMVARIEKLHIEIQNDLEKYADLFDAIDLWIGHDSGPENVNTEYLKLKATK